MPKLAAPLLFAAFITALPLSSSASTCYGAVGKGRLRDGVQLPARGKNFSAYSTLGIHMGRTFVHRTVREAVVAAYDALLAAAPDKQFVYGETGKATGGPIPPHRTHQNGLSVDFMVPVLDARGKSIPLPGSPDKQFGYGLEFDQTGRLGEVRIDFEAMAEHLYQLSLAARRRGLGIGMVIFDPRLTALLFQTKRGRELQSTLPFMKQKPWVRHDEHYHVDFSLPCRPLTAYSATGT